MSDIFENTILCKKCNKKMVPVQVIRDGFVLRAVKCPICSNKIVHPDDEKEYEGFKNLKNKKFQVKLRYIGNSYAVSIPREIIDFIGEQEKELKNMVDLCMEEMGRVSLRF